MKIALDIGHTSGRDQGAVSSCGLSEHAYWSTHAPLITQELERLGHTVKIFRREDHGGSVAAECRAVNTWNADAAISLHLNSADNKTATGHEVIYHQGSSRGKALAQAINDHLDNVPGLKHRNIRTPFSGRGDTWLSNTRCPAVIVEAGFLSNPEDVAVLKAQAARICRLIATGINLYQQH